MEYVFAGLVALAVFSLLQFVAGLLSLRLLVEGFASGLNNIKLTAPTREAALAAVSIGLLTLL